MIEVHEFHAGQELVEVVEEIGDQKLQMEYKDGLPLLMQKGRAMARSIRYAAERKAEPAIVKYQEPQFEVNSIGRFGPRLLGFKSRWIPARIVETF
tara:strand:- start:466 stop:753 length:288 start_codon:yes stop_codon:yes gene_type:complete